MSKIAEQAERAAQICAAVATAAFLSSGLVYLYLGRVPVTKADHWEIYAICLNHSWLDSALWKLNHHSLFFPNLIRLADLRFFHGDQQLLFFVGMMLLFGTAILLLVPVWRDKTVGVTAKLAATLVLIVGNFWMGRASITTSGGFLCENSLAIGGMMLACLWLPATRTEGPRSLKACLIVITSGFVASFSIANGMAVWPTLLLLGWSLRLRWRVLVVLLAGGLISIVIYVLLPNARAEIPFATISDFSDFLMAVRRAPHHLCMLLGAPFLWAEAAWSPHYRISDKLAATSLFSLSCGVLGLVFAGLAAAPKLIRRDLGQSRLELTALGLVIFNLGAIAIIVVGRTEDFRLLPDEVSARRYLFWSSLFWTGLLLVAIQRAEWKTWLRWPVYLLALAASIGVFPSHYKEGRHWRFVNYLAESGAVSLINNVRDTKQIQILFKDPEQVYRVAAQLRTRRLDMFAGGLQDWIGLPETSLFAGHQRSAGFKGECHVDRLVQSEDGTSAARVTGRIGKRGHTIPKTLVIVDPAGVIQGVARSWGTNEFISRIFYRGQFSGSGFLGYIRDYNPHLQYAVRCADDGTLSDEKIVVDTPANDLSTP
jgi:hypothetical protein